MSYSSDDDWDSYGPPSVSRDGFIFKDGKFYAKLDSWPGHTRADPAEIHRLVTYTPPPPKMTKAGTVAKHQPKDTHKDPEQHFYAAQMIHYGLKPLKTKAPAKKKLLAAFGDEKTLQVPKTILDLEASMKKEWEKLNLEYRAEQERLRKIQEKRDEEFNLQMAKEAKARTREPKPVAPPPAPRTNQTPAKTNGVPSIEARVAAVDRPKKQANLSKMSIAEMGAAITSLSVVQARQILTNLLDNSPAVRSALEDELAFIKDDSASSKGKAIDPSVWTGLYDVEAPSKMEDINYRFEDDGRPPPLTFEIYPSSTSSHLWASFQLGLLSGFMRSINPVPKFLNKEVHFEYRGYEAGENLMTFDDKTNRAVITFLPGGLFDGKINTDCFGNFKIYGALQAKGPGGKPTVRKTIVQQRAAIKDWKAGYRHINGHNFEVANISRWGRWGGETKDEQAFESDTTVGKKKHPKVDLNSFIKDSEDDLDERYGPGGSDDDEEVVNFGPYCAL